MGRREPTLAALAEGFAIFKDKCLPQMAMDAETSEKIIAYLEKQWMVEKWIRAWPDAGRVLMRLIEFVSTNNGIERGHRTMTKVACGDMILKVSLAIRAGADRG